MLSHLILITNITSRTMVDCNLVNCTKGIQAIVTIAGHSTGHSRCRYL